MKKVHVCCLIPVNVSQAFLDWIAPVRHELILTHPGFDCDNVACPKNSYCAGPNICECDQGFFGAECLNTTPVNIESPTQDNSVAIAIGIVVPVAFLLIVTLIALFLWRRIREKRGNKVPTAKSNL